MLGGKEKIKMADNKKYYYLKLKENFYDSEEMILLQNMQDGYLYSDILMKLYLRSLKNNGKLMFKDVIPYTPELLASVVRHQVGTVKQALAIFQKLGLIEVLDSGAIFMSDIQNYIGNSSTEADRKREYRDRIAQEKLGEKELKDICPDISPPEIEIEIELEKEKELKIERKQEDITKKRIREVNQRRNIGNIYTVEKNDENSEILTPIEVEFEELWKMYPNKQGKREAEKKYIKAREKGNITFEEVKNGIDKYLIYCKQNKDWYHPKNGSTWFNQESWNDDIPIKEFTTKDLDIDFTNF